MAFYSETTVPDGEYAGKWSGYELKFEAQGRKVLVRTKQGVRGIDIPVHFFVIGGRVNDKSIRVDGE